MEFIQYYISQDFTHALGWTVLHSLWQGFLIAVIMAFVLQFFRKKSAKTRYEVASFSLFLILVSSVCTFIWYFESVDHTVVEGMLLDSSEASVNVVTGATDLQGFMQLCINYFNEHMPMIVLIWLVGASFFLLKLLGGLVYIQRLKYQRVTLLPDFWQGKVNVLASKIPTKKVVQIFESAYVKVPMMIGYFKPVILLPLGVINHLEENEVEAIIAHELAHIFRNDYLMNIFISVVEVLFYFNPAVWWVSQNIRLERESCCDDIAIKVCGNALTYAKALMRIQELNAYVPRLAMSFSGHKNQLLNRVKRILNQPQGKNNIMEKITASCFVLIAIVLMSFSSNKPHETTTFSDRNSFEEESFLDINEEEDILNVQINLDTIPEETKKSLKADRVEITKINGGIDKIIINGEEIPKSEYEQYDEIISDNKIIIRGSAQFDSLGFSNSFPTSSSPVKFRYFNTEKQQKITKNINEDGETVIVFETQGDDPVEVVVDNQKEYIYVDGNKIGNGDTAIIIDGSPSFPNRFHFFNSNEPSHLSTDSIFLRGKVLHGDSMTFWTSKDTQFKKIFFKEKKEEAKELEKMLEKANLFILENDFKNKELREEWLAKVEENKELNELYNQEGLSFALKEIAENKLRLENANALYFKSLELERFNLEGEVGSNEVAWKLANALKSDGIIGDTNDFSFSLTLKKLKVNGKKQPTSVLKKYLKFYEELSGKSMNNKSSFKINFKQD